MSEQIMDKQKFIEDQLRTIKKVCELHEKIENINVSLKTLQPIAIVDNNIFYVFDINKQINEYEFIMEYPTPMPVPENVLAAFPLDFYDGKSTAVISANVLENPDNYIFVYHEFVHCYQWNTFEQKIRQKLKIEKQQKQKNNYTWEINYPFPYEDNYFITLTKELSNVPKEQAFEIYVTYHQKVKAHLNEIDYEYMIWQEWKEGFARYIENLARTKLGLMQNHTDLSPQYDRVCFYEVGSKYIKALIENNNTLSIDLEALYYQMKEESQ